LLMNPMAVMFVANGQGLIAVIIPKRKADKKGILVPSNKFCKNSIV
jgi:hypothetical protein